MDDSWFGMEEISMAQGMFMMEAERSDAIGAICARIASVERSKRGDEIDAVIESVGIDIASLTSGERRRIDSAIAGY